MGRRPGTGLTQPLPRDGCSLEAHTLHRLHQVPGPSHFWVVMHLRQRGQQGTRQRKSLAGCLSVARMRRGTVCVVKGEREELPTPLDCCWQCMGLM